MKLIKRIIRGVDMQDTNSGDQNSGYRNSGYRNSGYRNSGNQNSGYRNSGYRNSGYRNSGNQNSGDWNSGNQNSGYRNSGYRNSGDWNSGNQNSGYRNSGYRNSGDWNSGNQNSGAFNRDTPKMRLFEKELDMTVEEFYNEYSLHADLPMNRWINSKDMTTEEKSEIRGWETRGGYLKTLEYKEACKIWWEENPDEHERFLSLPGFDWEIFTDITGIEKESDDEVEINGKKYSASTIQRALEAYVKEDK